MSIKEKLLDLNREAEQRAAQRAAEEQRQREAAEVQQRAEELRQENLKKARFETGRHILESKGIPAVMGEVLEILKQEDPQFELNIREGYLFEKMGKVETVGVFVGRNNSKIGVELNSHNLTSLYVSSPTKSSFFEEEDIFSINDRRLIPKVEAKLAELIFGKEYKLDISSSHNYDYDNFGGG